MTESRKSVNNSDRGQSVLRTGAEGAEGPLPPQEFPEKLHFLESGIYSRSFASPAEMHL